MLVTRTMAGTDGIAIWVPAAAATGPVLLWPGRPYALIAESMAREMAEALAEQAHGIRRACRYRMLGPPEARTERRGWWWSLPVQGPGIVEWIDETLLPMAPWREWPRTPAPRRFDMPVAVAVAA